MPHRLVVLCLLATSSLVWCKATAQRPSLSGQWEGAVQIPGCELRVVVDLAQQDQEWVGSLTAPEFGVKGTPLSGIAVKQSDVEFESKGAASFKGNLETNGELKANTIVIVTSACRIILCWTPTAVPPQTCSRPPVGGTGFPVVDGFPRAPHR
jgi:hypothetical protein